MDADIEKRLEELEQFVGEYKRDDLEPMDFWDGFHAIAGNLDELAFADDCDPEVRERYTACLANADDAGFMVSNEMFDMSRHANSEM